MCLTDVFASAVLLFPVATPDNQDLTVSCHWIPEALSFQLDLMFISAAVKPKSNAVGFNLKLFNSMIDKYLL